MELIGYFLSILIGIALGLLGGGGSILTVPLLVYFFHVNPLLASSYSLIIVGFSSALGLIPNFKKSEIEFNAALRFGVPSVITVFCTKFFLVPLIPQGFDFFGKYYVQSDKLLMIFFASLLILSANSMIKSKNTSVKNVSKSSSQLLFIGLLTGFITGIIGIGGGFLIVPALVQFCAIEIKKAVSTSLLIILMNSIIGLLAIQSFVHFDFIFILKIVLISTLGLLIGIIISNKINNQKLKVIFGWFLLIMGIAVLSKELIWN